ncbi:MAG: META domain-containing protein [Alphaproteobacteria bacterium]|jgi:heat shock protein HslJ|nr:META domain-containing protein [Alphaproteobacteria bacterium]
MKKIFILFCLLALNGCMLIAPNQKEKLMNKDLTLIVDSRLSQEHLPFLFIKADGRVSGSTGCNRLLGQATFGNTGELVFKSLATTKMFCFFEGDMEEYFVNGLNNTAYYFINDNIVYFLDSNQDKIFALKIRD